jgi:hypothetical protein
MGIDSQNKTNIIFPTDSDAVSHKDSVSELICHEGVTIIEFGSSEKYSTGFKGSVKLKHEKDERGMISTERSARESSAHRVISTRLVEHRNDQHQDKSA